MKPFKNENDVRKAVREKAISVWWIENKRGGTAGFPDCVACFVRGEGCFIELKLVSGHENGALSVEAAPQQLRIVEELLEAGMKAFFLGGLKGSQDVGIWPPRAMKRVGKSGRIGARVRYDLNPTEIVWIGDFVGKTGSDLMGLVFRVLPNISRERARETKPPKMAL